VASAGPADFRGVGRSIVANVSHVPAPRVGGTVRRSRIRRSRRRNSHRLLVRCAGDVGVADSSFVTRRHGPVRSSALRREDLAARPGHAPTRPLARCSATTARGFRAALPGEWFFPLPHAAHARLPAITSPTLCVCPPLQFLARRRSWGSLCPSQVCSRIRVVASRDVRGGRIALRAIPAAFLSDRAHVPFSPDLPHVPIDFRRDDRPPLGGHV
jgi:hypothetical protein